jgi:transcriptional regulator with GAF, ATPase, and Fis domain
MTRAKTSDEDDGQRHMTGPLATEPASLDLPGTSRTSGHASVEVADSVDRARVGTRVQLSEDLVLIGREFDGAGIRFKDSRVSATHLRLTFDPRARAYRLGDAGSRNGTFVNGKLVRSALLSDGDVLRAGDSLLVFSQGDVMQALRARSAALARSDVSLMLRGETGVGKELLARDIHGASGRSGPFVALNCAGIPHDLIGAELFGHTRGAFSGAVQGRKGLFQAADGGTLFLDEIGDCPIDIQISLLRVLQEKTVRPVGSESEQAIDVRVVAATHADLEEAMEQGSFRSDLYARLAQATLLLPPLRQRKTEVLLLARRFAEDAGVSLSLTADAAEALLCWHWPFNIRELESLIRTFAALAAEAADKTLDLAYLHESYPDLASVIVERRRSAPGGDPTPDSPANAEEVSNPTRLRRLLKTHTGNVAAVARDLGKPRSHVYRWMRALGLSASRFRK